MWRVKKSLFKLIDESGVSFILNRDWTLKRIKFDNVILDKNEEFLPEEKNLKLEADFILMSNTLLKTLENLKNIINKL